MHGGTADSPRNRAWVEFFVQHEAALFAYALYLEGSVHDAEDLLQGVLLRVVQRPRAPRDRRAYVLRALRNASFDRGRSRRAAKARAAGEDALLFLADPAPPETADDVEAAGLRAALGHLEPGPLEVVVLKCCADLTLRQIADLTGRPLGTVASLWARALGDIRARLAKETTP